MRKPATSIIKNEDGVTVIEYGLLAALISVIAFVAMQLIGVSLSELFGRMGNAIEGVTSSGTGT